MSWKYFTLIVILCAHEECGGFFAKLGAPEVELRVHKTTVCWRELPV